MPKISAVIIAFNEEDYIGRCLASLEGVADEIIVIDSLSEDSTEDVCKKFGVRFITHPFEGYIEQKNYALQHASFPYVLSLDADEALSDRLRKSILDIKEMMDCDGYRFNRMQNYCGRWIKHSRWYPDRQLRLFNPQKGRWKGLNPHDKFIPEPGSKIRHLRGDLLHWNYSSIEDHMNKMNLFSTISAESYFAMGKKATPLSGILHMGWSFFRSYILWAGFLDGYAGFMGCSITAWASFLKYSKLRVMQKDKGKER